MSQEGIRVRIIPTGAFDKHRSGSLGDGRYASLEPGVTGIISGWSKDDDLHMMPSFTPDGLPEGEESWAWRMDDSCFEEYDGPEVPTTIYRNAAVKPQSQPITTEKYLVLYENGTYETFFTAETAITAKDHFAGDHRVFKAMTEAELKGEV